LASKTTTDQRRHVADVCNYIRNAFPTATLLHLKTRGQDHGYGFTISDVRSADGQSLLTDAGGTTPAPIEEALSLLACRGVVVEDANGHATLKLYNSQETPRPLYVTDGEVLCPHLTCQDTDSIVAVTTVTERRPAEFEVRRSRFKLLQAILAFLWPARASHGDRITSVDLSKTCCEDSSTADYECHTCGGPVQLPDGIEETYC
jgi:hypothetical protein